MKKILGIGASNSKKSINRQFASWAISQVEDMKREVLDLNDYEMPIYSKDRENESGIPAEAKALKSKIKAADAIIISFAEYNGSYTSAYKNIIDWVSRIEKGIWANKPLLLLSTSPGGRGALNVLTAAKSTIPHQGAQVVGSFSLPSFNQNFDQENGIVNEDLLNSFSNELEKLTAVINQENTIPIS